MTPDAEYCEIKTEVEILFPASGGSDLRDPVTGRTVIPETVLIHLYRSETPDEEREWASVHVCGPRRLKDGTAGREISSFGWGSAVQHGNPGNAQRPDWLTALLAEQLPEDWNPALLGLKTAGA
jgi:hypothetical protein